jgi:hypothetical protein
MELMRKKSLIIISVLFFLSSCSSGNESNTQTDEYSDDNAGFSQITSDSITAVYSADLALGDIDGDGDNDLILSGKNQTTSLSEIYLNDGTGRYSVSPSNSLAPVHDSSMALDDFDQDGDLDLVLLGKNDATNVASFYVNNGDGLFSTVSTEIFDALSAPSLDAEDIDENGSIDLIVSGYSGDSFKVVLYKNDGAAEFSRIEIASYDNSIQKEQNVRFADLDNDNDKDVVFIFYDTRSGHYKITIYQNDGFGHYLLFSEENVTQDILSEEYCNFSLIDFDLDQDIDILLVCDFTAFRHWAGLSKVLLNNGDGLFELAEYISLPTYQASFCRSDIDKDGVQDILAVGGDHMSDGIYIGHYHPVAIVYQSSGQTGYQETDYSGIAGVRDGACELGDVNGDGKVDIVVTGIVSGTGSLEEDLEINVYRNDL